MYIIHKIKDKIYITDSEIKEHSDLHYVIATGGETKIDRDIIDIGEVKGIPILATNDSYLLSVNENLAKISRSDVIKINKGIITDNNFWHTVKYETVGKYKQYSVKHLIINLK